MFNNIALDVFIGLVFIFLLYSLLVTVVQEIIANFLSLRARMLHKGIRRMLEDDSGQSGFIKAFYDHPTIKYLAENSVFSKPAYLHAATFSQTLIHLLRGQSFTNARNQMEAVRSGLDNNPHGIPPETLTHLNNLFIDAKNDIDVFASKLEKWYDDTMDRVSGWYKRQTQWILIGIGFVVAIIGNIDTIKIYRLLSRDKGAREQLVNMAIKSRQNYETAINELRKQKDSSTKKGDTVYLTRTAQPSLANDLLDQTFKNVSNDAQQANNILGLGWYTSANYKHLRAVDDSLKALGKDTTGLASLTARRNELADHTLDTFSLSSIPGWLLLALAVSMGAPFWFDLLNKFINLRNAGVKPPTATASDSGSTSSITVAQDQIKVIEKNG